eukprot:7136977-Pyramimonas_sp.AAC.1
MNYKSSGERARARAGSNCNGVASPVRPPAPLPLYARRVEGGPPHRRPGRLWVAPARAVGVGCRAAPLGRARALTPSGRGLRAKIPPPPGSDSGKEI